MFDSRYDKLGKIAIQNGQKVREKRVNVHSVAELIVHSWLKLCLLNAAISICIFNFSVVHFFTIDYCLHQIVYTSVPAS